MPAKIFFLSVLSLCLNFSAHALSTSDQEFDPFDPNAEKILESYDRFYEANTGLSAFPSASLETLTAETCYQSSCVIFIDVNKSAQSLNLYLNGRLSYQWPISSGKEGHTTPNFDRHPDGRIYQRFSSTVYPGGDYQGLGNMPYAIFIAGGFAIHGTPEGNWGLLGHVASHGCIRIHPLNAVYLNQIVRQVGVANTWVSVHD